MRILFNCSFAFLLIAFAFSSAQAIKHESIAITTAGVPDNQQNNSMSAQDGVKLLENIFEKMHSMPQIAYIPFSPPALGQMQFQAENNSLSQSEPSQLAAPMYYQAKRQFQQLPSISECRKIAPIPVPARQGFADEKKAEFNKQSADLAKFQPEVLAAKKPCLTTAARLPAAPTLNEPSLTQGFADHCSGKLLHKAPMAIDASPAPNTSANISRGIALLPPTVVTGISLVRLGDSQDDLVKAIAKLNNFQLKKESVHGWSVWFLIHGKVQELYSASFYASEQGKCNPCI